MASAGDWEIRVYSGGHPIWCSIRLDGEEVARVSHFHLRDLEYTVSMAMKEAKRALPEAYKDEV